MEKFRGEMQSLRGGMENMRGNMETLQSNVENLQSNTGNLRAEVEMLRGELNHQYRDLVERIADGQTELLKAFYGCAQGKNKRVAALEGNEGAFRSRLATIEDRILEVERRLNIPPAA